MTGTVKNKTSKNKARNSLTVTQDRQRVQKLLSHAGYGSRREIEGWIAEGRVRINGRVARLGDRAGIEDALEIDGRPVSRKRIRASEPRVILYNKPEGELVTRHDPEGRPTVFQALPRLPSGRWIPVGRLDINSSGLLLLTNDGELANALMHPSNQVEREYAVRVNGRVDDEAIRQLVHGVRLEDGPARFEDVVDVGGEGANHWFHVVIVEGRKREVRRMWEAIGLLVSRLIRVRYGPIELGARLKPGRWRELDKEEFKRLYQLVGRRPPRMPARPLRNPIIKKQGRVASPWKRR